jgi:hypothetical protein
MWSSASTRLPPGRTKERSGGTSFIHQVHFGFELGDFGRGNARLARMHILGKSGENRAEVE